MLSTHMTDQNFDRTAYNFWFDCNISEAYLSSISKFDFYIPFSV